jgi:flagellar hook-length control protein FliK
MNALPLATNTTPPAASASASATSTTPSAASEDFLLMLAQFLGGATASTPAATTTGGKAILDTALTDKDTDSAEAADSAALAAMLPFAPVTLPVPLDAALAAASAKGDGATDIKALMLDGVSAGAATAVDLLATSIVDKPVDDSKGSTSNANPAASALVDNSQANRAPAAADVSSNSRPLHNPVGTQAWTDELGTRLTILAERGGQHSASIRLSPEHLGPLEVRISVRDDQASVWFGAAHADTRAAIEQALPRLRELFASQGLSLADAGVFREPPRDQPRLAQSSSQSSANGDGGEVGQVVLVRSIRLGLVDAYA